MKNTIVIKRLTAGSVFKLVATGTMITLGLFGTLMGILAFFGAGTVNWNQQPLTGITGLFAGPILGLVFGFFLTILGWIGFCFSFRLVSLFTSMELEYVMDTDQAGIDGMDGVSD